MVHDRPLQRQLDLLEDLVPLRQLALSPLLL